jgi:hypothetical protein
MAAKTEAAQALISALNDELASAAKSTGPAFGFLARICMRCTSVAKRTRTRACRTICCWRTPPK